MYRFLLGLTKHIWAQLKMIPGLQTYSSILQCSGCVQSKNGVNLVEASIFLLVGGDKRSNCSADKDKNSSVFLSYHGHLVFKLVL